MSANNGTTKATTIVAVLGTLIIVGVIALVASVYNSNSPIEIVGEIRGENVLPANASTTHEIEFVVTHIKTPDEVRAIYVTAPVAGSDKLFDDVLSLFDDTDLNSIVIDVKDYSGRVSFRTENESIQTIGSAHNMIPNIKEFVGSLHDRGIYVIARIAVFQDPFAVKVRPEWSVIDKSTGAPWKDSGGSLWIDPSNREMWDYVIEIGHIAYEVGFDELNFDYIRFPSDGKVSNAIYKSMGSTTKADLMKEFYSKLQSEFSYRGIPISGDIFGQVTSDSGDMGIGQLFENALEHFDYVAPMVYPSHYIDGFINIPKPAEKPYEIVRYALDMAVQRSVLASTTPGKVRPWLQAFDHKAGFGPEEVKAQIRATHDAGLKSWMLWNPRGYYSGEAVRDVLDFKSSTSTINGDNFPQPLDLNNNSGTMLIDSF